jgi:hypothetical protein
MKRTTAALFILALILGAIAFATRIEFKSRSPMKHTVAKPFPPAPPRGIHLKGESYLQEATTIKQQTH